uniref:Medium-chain acyl-CoA ligase ACSF2, mitochondrial n=1 Tax=Periophthalmus magnuspinnatus TaxID=409849 RepID=A0A3B3ZX30_9GOBI
INTAEKLTLLYSYQYNLCFVNGRSLWTALLKSLSSNVHGTSSVSLLPLTVSQALDSTTECWPEREAVVCVEDGVRKTFAQFHQDVDSLTAGLLALGLKPGDRVGVWGPNSYEWILSQFGTAKAGMILVSKKPIKQNGKFSVICPSSFKTQKFSEILRCLCPDWHITKRLPDLRMVILMDSVQPGMLHFQNVMEAGESRHHRELMGLQSKLTSDDPINIHFTSGTTGNPKGVCLSHHNIVNNVYLAGLRMGFRWRVMCVCVPVPLYHTFGCVVGGMCMAVHGITLVFPSKAHVSNSRCNIIYGTPTMYIDMLNHPDRHTFDLSSTRRVMCLNSPLAFLGFPLDSDELKFNTVGCIMPHTELLIRGRCVMLEYWEDEAKTKEAIGNDRWYRTGDIASLTSRGYCVINGRIKDLIIRGGENIYPAEIEQFLFTHPKVKEVQVSNLTTREQKKRYIYTHPAYCTHSIKKTELKEIIQKKLGIHCYVTT